MCWPRSLRGNPPPLKARNAQRGGENIKQLFGTGAQRQDKAGAHRGPTPGIPWQVHAGAHCSANVVSDTQKTFKKSGNVQLFVDLKSFTFVLQPSLCPGLMCVGTLGLGNRRAREP